MLIKQTETDKKLLSNKTRLIAQEIKFARLLANNDKKIRDKVLKNLKKWLVMRSQNSLAFTESDFMRLWKGLFYCMWMSDKPLVQEELAESLSKIIHCFNSMDTALLYTKCTLKSLATEWFGIDRYRIDKFEMLVKRILRQTFEMCKRQSWNKQWVVGISNIMEDILLDQKACLGLKLYITEVYMEELAKISKGKIPENIVTEFIKPFVIYLASIDDQRQIKQIVINIFRYLILQSDIGLDYTEKFNAWKQAGFPCKNIDEMQKIEISDPENNIDTDKKNIEDIKIKEIPLDPRAGRVDVEIPQLPFNCNEIVNLLKEHKFNKLSSTICRKSINRLINEFTKLNEGEMPLGVKEIPLPEDTKLNPYESAKNLLEFENELYADSSKNNRKRKRKDDITKFNDTFNNVEELIVPQNYNDPLKCSNTKEEKLRNKIYIKKLDDKFKDIKTIKQNNNMLKLSLKRKSKKLNLSDPFPSKKFKRTLRKLNNTLPECIEEYKTPGTDDLSANNGSTSCNWNIDISTSPIFTPTPAKILKEKKTMKKNIVAEKRLDSNTFKHNVPWLTPVLVRLEEENQTPESPNIIRKEVTKDSTKKRVKIMLQRNTAQNTSEYIRQIRKSPAIPYDSNRKPKAGVLKPSPVPSPVNPFYKRKIF